MFLKDPKLPFNSCQQLLKTRIFDHSTSVRICTAIGSSGTMPAADPKGHHPDMNHHGSHHPDPNRHGGHHMTFLDLFGLRHCFGWGAPTHSHHNVSHEHHPNDDGTSDVSHTHGSEDPVTSHSKHREPMVTSHQFDVIEEPTTQHNNHRELAQPNHKSHVHEVEKEIHVLGSRPHDHQVKHHITLPDLHGDRDRLGVQLAGREFTIKLPDDARAGDHITVIAPV